MCGRFATTQTDDELLQVFGAREVLGERLPPSCNVAPTQAVRVVVERAPREAPETTPVRQLRTARWGLVPSWSRGPKIGSRLINARMETITEKPSFTAAAAAAAAARRRAIVPCSGYYESAQREGTKVPYFLHGDGVLAMAGLYELWPNPDLPDDDPNKWMWTVTVLTTTATDAAGHIHDSAPVILPPALRGHWLDPTLTVRRVHPLTNNHRM
jgi:putative SOS response-associated peptidase YedK